MESPDTYWVRATLVAESDTAALLRIVSIFHGRKADVSELAYVSDTLGGTTITARVTSGNASRTTLECSLRNALEVVHVTTELV
jgi:hypothetical protein